MKVKTANDAFSTLAGNITNVATACSVQSGHGARFPNPVTADGEYFYATLADASGNKEIIKVTARSGDTFTTIVRGQDGTTGLAFLTGDRISLRVNRGSVRDQVKRAILSKSAGYTAEDKDLGRTIIFTAAATLSIDAVANLGADGWWLTVKNNSTGDVTLDPAGAELIDGLATAVIPPGTGVDIFCDGTAIYTIRAGGKTPGEIFDFGGSVVPGWAHECDGSSKTTATDPALFAKIGYTWGGSGPNFNVPDFRDRSRKGRGTGTTVASGVNADVDTSTDGFTVPSNLTKFVDGMRVNFVLASGTITGLTSGVDYFIVRTSATVVKLATTLANAQNGTVIDLTAKAAPVWSLTHTHAARTLGEIGGANDTAETSTTQLQHLHGASTDSRLSGNAGMTSPNASQPQPSGGLTGSTLALAHVHAVTINNTGGNALMNNESPFGVVMTLIAR